MKNTFSKSLLCGIIASTFLLANCQKAPSGRGVKSQVGDPGPATDTTEGKVSPAGDVGLAMAKCSSEFNKAYDSLWKISKDVEKLESKKDEPDLKEKMLNHRPEVQEAAKKALAEMAKLTPDSVLDKDRKIIVKTTTTNKLDGCYTEDKKTTYTIKIINQILEDTEMRITKVTNVDSPTAIAGRARLEKRQIERMQKLSYKVAKDFNELLEDVTSESSKHIVEGKIAEKNDFDENQKNKEKAVCYISLSPKKLDDDKLVLKTIIVTDPVTDGGKKLFSVRFENGISGADGSDTYEVKCSIPAKLSVVEGFTKAVGTLLTVVTENEKSTSEKVKAANEQVGDKDKIADKDKAAVTSKLTTKTSNVSETAASAKALVENLKNIENKSMQVKEIHLPNERNDDEPAAREELK